MNSPSDPSSWDLARKPVHVRTKTTVLAHAGYNGGQIAESDVTDEPTHSFEVRLKQLSGEL